MDLVVSDMVPEFFFVRPEIRKRGLWVKLLAISRKNLEKSEVQLRQSHFWAFIKYD